MKKVEMLNWQLIIVLGIVLLASTGIAHEKTVIVPLSGVEGNATAADVVKGKTFSSKAAGRGVTGILELLPTMQTYTTPTYGMTFNLLPADTFTMGSPDDEPDGPYDDEQPQHQVTLTKSFYMQTTEVTQQQWRDVLLGAEAAGYIAVGVLDEMPSISHPGAYKANYPVESVSWNDILDWINALNQLTGKSYRLPTEAEWEYAARATTKTAWAYAVSYDNSADPGQVIGDGFNSNLDATGWYSFNRSIQYADGTKPVARKQANKWGLYDMAGNVWEWCQDWYDSAYYSDPASTSDPQGPDTRSYRVIRGGGWNVGAGNARSANRNWGTPGTRFSVIGFRLALPSGQ